MLNTIHNLRYYQILTAEIREAIETDQFTAFVARFKAQRTSAAAAA